MELYHLCFTARVGGGQDLFTLQEYQYQLEAGARELEIYQRLGELNPGLGLATVDPYQPVGKYFRCQDDFLPDSDHAARTLESDGLLRQLLAAILRTGQPLSHSATQGFRRFQAAFEFIEAHLSTTIRLADLAQVTRMQKSYFANLFHTLVGVTPMEYITRRRVEASQLLLLTTKKSIKEIAFETGFNSSAAYCRSFLRNCNQTPTQFRTTHPLV